MSVQATMNNTKKRERVVGEDQTNTKKKKRVESEQGVHIWTERERRKRMRDMFTTLHGLLPDVSEKADKTTIVDEAVTYIKSLQQTLNDLEQRKLRTVQNPPSQKVPSVSFNDGINDSLVISDGTPNDVTNVVNGDVNGGEVGVPSLPLRFNTWTSTNVVLNLCGDEAQISVCTPPGITVGGEGVLTVACSVLERYNIEVVTAHVSNCSFDRRMYMLQVRHRGQENGAVQEGFTEGNPVEEIYKQAVNEFIRGLASST
ncbi:Transcription factor bHLH95, partial [Linum perenne]